MVAGQKISLVISDVDGTLVRDDKQLTPRSIDAVRALRRAGIRFAITSSRPPRGMAMFIAPLEIDTPIGGFNGGAFANPDMSLIEQQLIDAGAAGQSLDLMHREGLDVWVFSGNDWLVTDPNGPRVAHETRTVQFAPGVVPDFRDYLARANKIVGVSDDHERVARCDAAAQTLLRGRASASRSQAYYLDVTSLRANKGAVVDYLSAYLGIPRDEIATIGDSHNDVSMFGRSALSIAMGNAPDEVKAQAVAATDTNNADGFAKAIEHYVLRDAPG